MTCVIYGMIYQFYRLEGFSGTFFQTVYWTVFDPLNVFSVCPATRGSKWQEREERARQFHEKQLEERKKKLEEQRQREDRRHAAVEEKRRQRLEEEQVSISKGIFPCIFLLFVYIGFMYVYLFILTLHLSTYCIPVLYCYKTVIDPD